MAFARLRRCELAITRTIPHQASVLPTAAASSGICTPLAGSRGEAVHIGLEKRRGGHGAGGLGGLGGEGLPLKPSNKKVKNKGTN